MQYAAGVASPASIKEAVINAGGVQQVDIAVKGFKDGAAHALGSRRPAVTESFVRFVGPKYALAEGKASGARAATTFRR